MTVAWQTRNVQRQIDHGAKLEHLIQHTSIRSRASSRCYTFEACIFGAVRVRYDVEEVVVHESSWEVVVHIATVVELVVHVRFGEVLDESEFFGAIGYPFPL